MADHNIDFPVSRTFARHFDGTARDEDGSERQPHNGPAIITLETVYTVSGVTVTFLIPARDAREYTTQCKGIMRKRTADYAYSLTLLPVDEPEYWQIGGMTTYAIVECRQNCIEL